MQIAEMHRAIDDGAAIVACFAMRMTSFHAASHPKAEGAMLMAGLILVRTRCEARSPPPR